MARVLKIRSGRIFSVGVLLCKTPPKVLETPPSMAGGNMKAFGIGFIAGFIFVAIIFGCIAGFMYSRNRDRRIIEYAEKQIEIEALREDYSNRDPLEFLEDPGVRGVADGAAAEFDRKRDEALQRFRSGLIN